MRILLVSRWGESLDIGWALQAEGHDVRFFVEASQARQIGDGFVQKVRDWRKSVEWADLIIFDYTGYGEIATDLRASGKAVIGGTEYTDRLELDRQFGQTELRRHKINILGHNEFDDLQSAIDHIFNRPAAYVIKPTGETQENKQLLFVGNEDDGSDAVRILRAYLRTWGPTGMGTIQLQKRVKGVEVSVSGFFNGHQFLRPINVTFEHKKLFPGELGVSTGEMGTSMFWAKSNPIFEATLKKFEGTLSTDKFIGHIDLNCIVNGNGIYPLEFTSRFGFPQIFIQRAGIRHPLGEFFRKLAQGEFFSFNVRGGFQVGAYMVVPPFPFEDKKTFRIFSKDAVVVINNQNYNGIHPMHLRQVNHEWLITGEMGIAVLVTGVGNTMRTAQKMMYSRMQKVSINNCYYRTDIGDRWSEDSDKLMSWGLI